MREFSENIEDVYFPPIVKFKEEAAKRLDYLKPVLNLNQAIPNYPPPDVIKKAIIDETEKSSYCFYTFDEGTPELRQAVADSRNSIFKRKISTENICVVSGANNGFFSAVPVIASAGDEVILLTPFYFNHYMTLKIAGIRPVEVILDPDEGFALPFERIEKAITDRTRALVFVNPSNPTGKSYSQDDVDMLYSICLKHNIYLISDEVYSCFHDMYPAPSSVLNNTNFPERCVCINSFSKTYSMTGLRAGFVVSSKEFIRHFTKVQDSNVVCVSTLSQAAALAGILHGKEWLEEKIAFSRAKKEKFVKLFLESGSSFRIVSSGPFFVYLDIPDKKITAPELCFLMMEKENIVTLPGKYFGSSQDYAIRLALGNLHEHEIEMAVEKLSKIL